ncbi:MAG: hypothetical protein DME33_15230 [Verrucomicrobia bacterium]|nr:MAG: hypothetical protein DME33_15230 [Verrucomicrobiota bacterium]
MLYAPDSKLQHPRRIVILSVAKDLCCSPAKALVRDVSLRSNMTTKGSHAVEDLSRVGELGREIELIWKTKF